MKDLLYLWAIPGLSSQMKRLPTADTQTEHPRCIPSGTCSLASSVCLSSHQVLRRCAWCIPHLPRVPLCLSPSFQSTTSPLRYTKTCVKIPTTETGAFNIKLYSSVEKGEISFRELLFWTIFCHFHRRVDVGIKWFYYRNLEKSMQDCFFTQTE